jgi:hypothetical protein
MHVTSRRRLATLLGVPVFGLTLLVTWGATANATGVTVSSVLKTTKVAIDEQTAAHVVFTAKASSATEKIVADVGTTSGEETASEGTSLVKIRVTPTFAYLSGNQSGLTTIYGMSSADAKKVGADWETWKSGTKGYSNLKSDVTMASVDSLLPKAKGTKLTTDNTKGTTLYVLKWTTAATSSIPKLTNTLTVSAQGMNLPVTETSAASDGTKATTKLSRWGVSPVVNAPALTSTIASAKVSG